MANIDADQFVEERRDNFNYALFDAALDEVYEYAKEYHIDLSDRSTYYLVWEALHPGQRMDILITKESDTVIREWTKTKISERLGRREKGVRIWQRVRTWQKGDDLRKEVVRLKRNKDTIDIMQFIKNCEAEIELLEKRGAGLENSAEPLRQIVAYFKKRLEQIAPNQPELLIVEADTPED